MQNYSPSSVFQWRTDFSPEAQNFTQNSPETLFLQWKSFRWYLVASDGFRWHSGGCWFPPESYNISPESFRWGLSFHRKRESKENLTGRSSGDSKSHRKRFRSSGESSGRNTERGCVSDTMKSDQAWSTFPFRVKCARISLISTLSQRHLAAQHLIEQTLIFQLDFTCNTTRCYYTSKFLYISSAINH